MFLPSYLASNPSYLDNYIFYSQTSLIVDISTVWVLEVKVLLVISEFRNCETGVTYLLGQIGVLGD